MLSLTGVNSVTANYSQTPNFHFGPIASINQDWILAGKWMANMNDTNKTDAGFHSIFNMVMINGSAPHIHKRFRNDEKMDASDDRKNNEKYEELENESNNDERQLQYG